MLIQRLLRNTRRLLSLRTPSKVLCATQYRARTTRCDAHMNELPIPCGPWHLWYQEQQNFYNKVLVGGFLWWLFSLLVLIYSGALFFNFSPPAQPGPPSDMVEECEDEDTL